MKKILLLLIYCFVSNFVIGQSAPLEVSMKVTITTLNTFTDPYSVSGQTNDFTSNWNASDITAGDSLYLADGNELRIYRVVSIGSAISTNFTITIDDMNNTGSLPQTGEAALIHGTTNFGFPLIPAGLSETLYSMIDNRFKQRLDASIGSGSGGADTIYLDDGTMIINGDTLPDFNNTFNVAQTSHGFAVGDLIYRATPDWEKATARELETTSGYDSLAQAIVVEVTDANNFKAAKQGLLAISTLGIPTGSYIYLDTLAGLYTDSPSSSYTCQLIGSVVDTNKIGFLIGGICFSDASLTLGGDLSGVVSNAQIVTGAVGASELASTAVTPGSYTLMSGTVDADGRLTAASNGTVNLASQVTGVLPAANGGMPGGTIDQTMRYDTVGVDGWKASSYLTNTGSAVGINTAAPSKPLHVNGEAQIENIVFGEQTSSSVLQIDYSGGNSIVRNATSTGSLLLAGDNLSTEFIGLYGRTHASGSGIVISGGTQANDIAPRNLTITAPNAQSTATVNMDGADVVVNGGAKATAGGVNGDVVLANTRGNVGIGTSSPNAVSILDVVSTTKGSRPAPSMTITQINNIVSPVAGLLAYSTTGNKFRYHNGTNWRPLLDSVLADVTFWKQNGNSFGAEADIGSNDAFGINIETQGTRRLRFGSAGRMFTGTLTDVVLTPSDTANIGSTGSGTYTILGNAASNTQIAGLTLNAVFQGNASITALGDMTIPVNGEVIITSSGDDKIQLKTTANTFEVNDDSTVIDEDVYFTGGYGAGSVTGTPTYALGVDVNDKVIAVDLNNIGGNGIFDSDNEDDSIRVQRIYLNDDLVIEGDDSFTRLASDFDESYLFTLQNKNAIFLDSNTVYLGLDDGTRGYLEIEGLAGTYEGSTFSFANKTAQPVPVIQIKDADQSNFYGIKAPDVITSNYTEILPTAPPGGNGYLRTYDTDGTTQFVAPVVQTISLNFMHTPSRDSVVVVPSDSRGSIVIPDEYDGWEIVEVAYRTTTAVTIADLEIQSNRETSAGSSSNFAAGTITTTNRFDSVAGLTLTVASGDMITSEVLAVGSPSVTGLMVTLVLKNQ